MKLERIKDGEVYLVIYRGHEVLVRINHTVDFHVWCTVIDSNRHVALSPEAVRAGPIKIDAKQVA